MAVISPAESFAISNFYDEDIGCLIAGRFHFRNFLHSDGCTGDCESDFPVSSFGDLIRETGSSKARSGVKN